jgi:O-antigen ligase
MTVVAAKPFDLPKLAQVADWLAVGVAVSLPWSTSATGIFIGLWLAAVLPTLDAVAIRRELASAAGGLPVLLCLLAAVGMLWADVPWHDRVDAFDSFLRLLIVPLLLAQFRRSARGRLVLYGFLVSATCLLCASWAYALVPVLKTRGHFYGVPVKDYIIQSGIFLICAFALLGVAGRAWREQKERVAVLLIVLAVLFLANIAFVAAGRTIGLVAPFLVAAFGWRQFGWKGLLAAVVAACALAGVLWPTSSYLRERAERSVVELRAYLSTDQANSTGLHLEYLKKSLGIVLDAPLIGHGTGSIPEQFRLAAAGETGASGVATDNPHNQTFAVAIQLGVVGAVVLLAMWIAHIMLFRGGGLTAWLGMIVVIQNVISSLVNSHLFDFSQGWLYVFGVGVAGGMVLRERDGASGASSIAKR